MTRNIALMALTTLGLSGEPFHEPFHDPPRRALRSVIMRRAGSPSGTADNGGAPSSRRARNGSVCRLRSARATARTTERADVRAFITRTCADRHITHSQASLIVVCRDCRESGWHAPWFFVVIYLACEGLRWCDRGADSRDRRTHLPNRASFALRLTGVRTSHLARGVLPANRPSAGARGRRSVHAIPETLLDDEGALFQATTRVASDSNSLISYDRSKRVLRRSQLGGTREVNPETGATAMRLPRRLFRPPARMRPRCHWLVTAGKRATYLVKGINHVQQSAADSNSGMAISRCSRCRNCRRRSNCDYRHR